jgi:hypothetical protein
MTPQRPPGDGPTAPSAVTDPVVDSERRLEILWARVQRLEAEVEGLQDAVHRQAVLHDARIDELNSRTKPHQMARDLSQDARRRGV